VHQSMIPGVIHVLRQPEVPVEQLFADDRWRVVPGSAPRLSWLSVVSKDGFQCRMEHELPNRVDPVLDLIEISQLADAGTGREQLIVLTLWPALSWGFCREDNAVIVDHRGPLAWDPVLLCKASAYDARCMKVNHKHSMSRIEQEGSLTGIVSQNRFRPLETESRCLSLQIAIDSEYLCDSFRLRVGRSR
jgi:hypothetical protein